MRALLQELAVKLPGLLTPRWVSDAIAEEERCRQHGAAVGLTAEQVDEVMTILQRYNRRHFFGFTEEVIKERMTAYALGEEWRP